MHGMMEIDTDSFFIKDLLELAAKKRGTWSFSENKDLVVNFTKEDLTFKFRYVYLNKDEPWEEFLTVMGSSYGICGHIRHEDILEVVSKDIAEVLYFNLDEFLSYALIADWYEPIRFPKI